MAKQDMKFGLFDSLTTFYGANLVFSLLTLWYIYHNRKNGATIHISIPLILKDEESNIQQYQMFKWMKWPPFLSRRVGSL